VLGLALWNDGVFAHGVDQECSKAEFRLLAVLTEYPGQWLPASFLVERLGLTDVLELAPHIGTLREKLLRAFGETHVLRVVEDTAFSYTPV
jgi:DNA-binding response OmpR family regulator